MNYIGDTTENYYNEFHKLKIRTNFTIDQLCFTYSEYILRELLSKSYVNYIKFDENMRTNIKQMIELITSSFEQLMDENTWMDPVTKKQAKEKLLAIHSNIGGPDILFDDQNLEKQSAEVCY